MNWLYFLNVKHHKQFIKILSISLILTICVSYVFTLIHLFTVNHYSIIKNNGIYYSHNAPSLIDVQLLQKNVISSENDNSGYHKHDICIITKKKIAFKAINLPELQVFDKIFIANVEHSIPKQNVILESPKNSPPA